MKKMLLVMAVALAMLTTACGKDHTCHCTPVNGGEKTLVTLDRGMSCSSITRLGFERQLEGQLVRTLEDVECEEYQPE